MNLLATKEFGKKTPHKCKACQAPLEVGYLLEHEGVLREVDHMCYKKLLNDYKRRITNEKS